MFEKKSYITINTLEKLLNNGVILKFAISTYSYGQHLERRGNALLLDFEPEVVMSILDRYGNEIEMKCTKKKKTYKINQLFINKVRISK